MANLDDVLIFVKVAQFESISRAARSLGMPISTAVTEVGFAANPRFRRLLESEIPAFEVERLPECAGSLEESTVDQGMKSSASHGA
jgi:hypothetical protein